MQIKKILESVNTLAVVGLSPDESKDSHMVAKFLQSKGKKIVPVYPKEDEILGEKVYRRLDEIPFDIDCVVIFRKSEASLEITKEAVQLSSLKCVWMQIGAGNDEAEAIAEAVGIVAISDKCMMVEYKNVYGWDK